MYILVNRFTVDTKCLIKIVLNQGFFNYVLTVIDAKTDTNFFIFYFDKFIVYAIKGFGITTFNRQLLFYFYDYFGKMC